MNRIGKLLMLSLLISIFVLSLSADNKDKTIVAEYDGGDVTIDEIEHRLELISPMYRSKYETNAGKAGLLDAICTEKMFYRAALELKLDEEDEVQKKIELVEKPYFMKEMNNYLKHEVFVFSTEQKKEHFVEFADSLYPGLTFEEAEKTIDSKLRPKLEKEFLEQKEEEYFLEYKVTIDSVLAEKLDMENMDNNKKLKRKRLIDSSHKEVRMTVADLMELYPILDARLQGNLKKSGVILNYLNRMAKIEIYYLEALKVGLDKKEEIIEHVERIRQMAMLRAAYEDLVLDKIETSDEELQNYYYENIFKFSTKAARKVQTFAFDNKEEALNARKEVGMILETNPDDSEENLKEIVQKTLHPEKGGIKDNIYQNGIIPGVGRDEKYSETIWSIEEGDLSEVIENKEKEFVFVRILEDRKSIAKPFDEVKDSIEKSKVREESKELFQEVSAELEKKYHLVKHPDKLITKLTAAEYFKKAEEAQKKRRFSDAVFYYDQVLEFYPNGKDDYKALFMKAFLLAEEMDKKEESVSLFKEFLEKYPEGELQESAQFMLDELQENESVLDQIEEKK